MHLTQTKSSVQFFSVLLISQRLFHFLLVNGYFPTMWEEISPPHPEAQTIDYLKAVSLSGLVPECLLKGESIYQHKYSSETIHSCFS